MVRRLLRELLGPAGRREATPPRPRSSSPSSREPAPDVLPWAPLIAQAIGAARDGHRRDPGPRRGVPPAPPGPGRHGPAGRAPAGLRAPVHRRRPLHGRGVGRPLRVTWPRRSGSTSWLICIARRDLTPASWRPTDWPTASTLGPLDRSDALELARRVAAEGTPLSPPGSSTPWSTGRAGNPLFLRELLAAALARRRRRRPARHRRRGGGGPHRQSVDRRPVPAPPAVGARPVVPARPGPRRARRAAPRVGPGVAAPRRVRQLVRDGRPSASATGCSATAPTTGCRSASVAASTSRPVGRIAGHGRVGETPARAPVVPLPPRPAVRRRRGSTR